MFSYLQLPFLQALGYAIANSIWQVFLLWLIVMLLNNTIRQSSHVKYATALSAQVAGFVWFLTTFQFYYRHCLAASAQLEQIANGNTAIYLQNIITDNSILSVFVRGEETLPYLSLAYLCFLGYLVVKWMQSFRFTKKLSATGLLAADSHWQTFVNELADRMNIMQDVKIHLSSLAKSPLTIGYLKPVILLPVACINHLTTEQLEAVILHEMAHIKRADYIINLMVSIAEMIMFFNPFTRLLCNVIQKEREHCCDDQVLQYQYNAGMYAKALLRIACLHQEGFQMNAAAQQKGELLQRVKRMIQPTQKKFSYRHQATAMMVIAGLLFCIAWLQPGENSYHKAITISKKKEDRKIMIAPVIAQVDNPFFNGASLFSSSLHNDMMQSVTEMQQAVPESLAIPDEEEQKDIKTAPATVTTLSSGDWQKMMNTFESDDESNPLCSDGQPLDLKIPLRDSIQSLQNLGMALAKNDRLTNIETSLETAKEKMKSLSEKDPGYSFSFSTDYLNSISANAFAAIRNLHFAMRQDSIMAASDRIKTLTHDIAKKAQEKFEKQVRLLKQLQERRNKIWAATTDKRNKRLLPPMPPAAPRGVLADEDEQVPDMTSDSDNYDASDEEQPVTTNWSFSEPASINNTGLSHTVTSKTVHIIRNDNKSRINIIIEIRQ